MTDDPREVQARALEQMATFYRREIAHAFIRRDKAEGFAERADACDAGAAALNALAELLRALELLFSYSPSRRTDTMWGEVDRTMKYAQAVLAPETRPDRIADLRAGDRGDS